MLQLHENCSKRIFMESIKSKTKEKELCQHVLKKILMHNAKSYKFKGKLHAWDINSLTLFKII